MKKLIIFFFVVVLILLVFWGLADVWSRDEALLPAPDLAVPRLEIPAVENAWTYYEKAFTEVMRFDDSEEDRNLFLRSEPSNISDLETFLDTHAELFRLIDQGNACLVAQTPPSDHPVGDFQGMEIVKVFKFLRVRCKLEIEADQISEVCSTITSGLKMKNRILSAGGPIISFMVVSTFLDIDLKDAQDLIINHNLSLDDLLTLKHCIEQVTHRPDQIETSFKTEFQVACTSVKESTTTGKGVNQLWIWNSPRWVPKAVKDKIKAPGYAILPNKTQNRLAETTLCRLKRYAPKPSLRAPSMNGNTINSPTHWINWYPSFRKPLQLILLTANHCATCPEKRSSIQ